MSQLSPGRAKVGDWIVAEICVDVEVTGVTERGYQIKIVKSALELNQTIDESQFYETIEEEP